MEPVRAERPDAGDPHLHVQARLAGALRDGGRGWLADDPTAQIALVGDWNVAPRDDDVWDMAVFADVTHVSPPEREAFGAVVDAGFADVVRPYAPGPGASPTGTTRSCASPAGGHADRLHPRLARAGRPGDRRAIDREERKGKGASDHAPVVVDLDG